MKEKKNHLLLAFLFLGMLFSSCSKDPAELIVGTWNVDRTYGRIKYLDGIEECVASHCDVIYSKFVFNSNGYVDLTYTFANETKTIHQRYEIIGDCLKLANMNNLTIEELTKESLILSHTSQYMGTEHNPIGTLTWYYTYTH